MTCEVSGAKTRVKVCEWVAHLLSARDAWTGLAEQAAVRARWRLARSVSPRVRPPGVPEVR